MKHPEYIQTDQKLVALLKKYRLANRARLTEYARRSRFQCGTFKDGDRVGVREWTAKHENKLQASVLKKLKASKRLRAYCKSKKLHLCWGQDNQIVEVKTHIQWQMSRKAYTFVFFRSLRLLQLCKSEGLPY